MLKYVLQIRDSDGFLIKSFTVNGGGISPVIPPGRTQIVMTNKVSYDEIVSVYDEYTSGISYSYDEPAATVSCTGAYIHTWDID